MCNYVRRKEKLYENLLRFLKTVFLAMHLFMQTSVFLAEARTFMALRWYLFLLCASQYWGVGGCGGKMGRENWSLGKVWYQWSWGAKGRLGLWFKAAGF